MRNQRQGQLNGDYQEEIILKVALATPTDVLAERLVFFGIIEKVNDMFASLSFNTRLEPVAWENTHPDAGSPQEVILNQLRFKDCDIFVGVFWQRFGTPPGDNRPDDGKPYLSGTEKEIEEAFQARRTSKVGRPIIMLYRKGDPPPSGMNDDNVVQYARVIEFFRDCEPGGRHEALVAKFTGNAFGELLERHLVKAVQDIRNSCIQSRASPAEPSVNPKQRWLEQVHLTVNPFETNTAEQEPDLEHYYLHIGAHRPIDLVRNPKHWFCFADPGCGKTALAKMVEPLCFPKKAGSDVLYLRFGRTELQHLLAQQPTDASALDAQSFLRNLMQSAVETIGAANRRLTPNASAGAPSNQFAALLASAGLRRALCVLDQVDELATVNGDPARIAALLKPITVLSFREPLLPELTFRCFLPTATETWFAKEAQVFRLDRCQVTHLIWGVADLKRLIQERLSQHANPPGSCASLGQLCDSAHGFAAAIDQDVAELAEGCPRAAIWLANQLIEIHCQKAEAVRLIQISSWLLVKQEWRRSGRKHVFGVAETFWMSGSEVYFGDRRVALSPLNDRLLRALIEAGDSGCSKDELKKAGWPTDSPDGISNRALDEAMRRLRLELTGTGFDACWVHTDHRRGYRLRKPEQAA